MRTIDLTISRIIGYAFFQRLKFYYFFLYHLLKVNFLADLRRFIDCHCFAICTRSFLKWHLLYVDVMGTITSVILVSYRNFSIIWFTVFLFGRHSFKGIVYGFLLFLLWIYMFGQHKFFRLPLIIILQFLHFVMGNFIGITWVWFIIIIYAFFILILFFYILILYLHRIFFFSNLHLFRYNVNQFFPLWFFLTWRLIFLFLILLNHWIQIKFLEGFFNVRYCNFFFQLL